MRTITSAVVMTALLGAGCAARVGYSASVSSGGYGYGPDLVYAGPGVQVIADFDEAIFFADSFYWRFDAGRWYRSPHYTGGWVYATPPAAVLRIDRPHAYVHYRPHGWTGRRGGVAPQPNQPRVEGRRGAPPPRQPTYQQPPPRMQPQQQPQPRFQQQPPQPRMQRPPQYQHPPRMQPPFREGPPAPRGPDRRDNRGSGDRGRR